MAEPLNTEDMPVCSAPTRKHSLEVSSTIVIEEGGCEFSFQRPVFEALPKHLSQKSHEPNKRGGCEFSIGNTKDSSTASRFSSGKNVDKTDIINSGSDSIERVDGGSKIQACPPRTTAGSDGLLQIKHQKLKEGDYVKFDGPSNDPSYNEKPFDKAASAGCMYEIVYAVMGELCIFTYHERPSKIPKPPDGLVHNFGNSNTWDTSQMTTNVMPQSTFDYKWGVQNSGPGPEVIEGRS